MPNEFPPCEQEEIAQVVLQNLQNALNVWGEGSKQYHECRVLAQDFLRNMGTEGAPSVHNPQESEPGLQKLLADLAGLAL